MLERREQLVRTALSRLPPGLPALRLALALRRDGLELARQSLASAATFALEVLGDALAGSSSATPTTCASSGDVRPDLIVEMFVFDSEGSSDAIEATAEGQLEEGEQGTATDEEALDRPTSRGQL